MFSLLNQAAGPAATAGMLLLTLLALAIVLALIILVETVVLQLLRWGDFQQSLRAAVSMNVLSALVGLLLLAVFPRPNMWGLLAAAGGSAMIETGVLARLRRGFWRANLVAALLANAASYLILIVPAYLFRG